MIASSGGEAGLVLFLAVLASQKMALDAITFLRVGPNAKMVALLQNQVVGMLGGLDNQSLLIPQKGVQIIDFPYSDLGVNTVGLCIQASETTIAKNPDLVRRFIAATRPSFDLAQADPDPSIPADPVVQPDPHHHLPITHLTPAL